MPATAPTYDLTLLLSTETEDERRTKVLTDVESAISTAGGSVERHDNWGQRPMAYRIKHQGEAEYHLLQFTGPTTLLESLTHSLHIDDGVLRFRIIKVLPGTPAAPDSPPPIASAPAPVPMGTGGAPSAPVSAPASASASASAEIESPAATVESPAETTPEPDVVDSVAVDSEPEADE
jgi:small subunit ribosomal protein S6